MCYRHARHLAEVRYHQIEVRFPRGKIQSIIKPVSPQMMGCFPNARKTAHFHSLLSVRIAPDAEAEVVGLGNEYHNPDEPQIER